jgi:hypothetical protein
MYGVFNMKNTLQIIDLKKIRKFLTHTLNK